jgi:hypothetical protein
MRRAIVKAALFVVLFVLLDRLVYAGMIFLRDAVPLTETADLLYREDQNPQIVFFGDSRTRHHFDMHVIQSATGLVSYNFAVDGANTAQSLFMLEEYLRHGHQPRIVVFEADPPLLDSRYQRFDKSMFREHLAFVPDAEDLVEAPHLSWSQLVSAFSATWLAKTASLPNRLPDIWKRWRKRSKLREVVNATLRPCGEYQCIDYNGSSLIVPTEKVIVPQKSTYRIDELPKRLYRRVAELAATHHFWLVLDEVPLFQIDEVYPRDISEEARDFYCGLAKAHDEVLYARLLHGDGIDKDASLYYDWAHLNRTGAEKLSRVIAPLLSELIRSGRAEPCVLQ